MAKVKEQKRGEIILYKAKQGPQVEVRLEGETIWATQAQIADVFNTTPQNITLHLRNIYKGKELQEKQTCKESLQVQIEGIKKVKRSLRLYSLDAIIAVGYRVNSKQATAFRIWATKTLKDFLVQGYVVNEKRLLEAKEKFAELQQTVTFLTEKSKKELLTGQEGEILSLLASYAKTLTLLDEYDKGKIKETKGVKSKFVLSYENCARIVAELKKELVQKKEAGDLFGQERGGSFEGIIKGLYQIFGGKELYSTTEDKASHLLYLIIKDHPFSDGNKRSAAFLFVYFLDKTDYLFKNSGERKISDNTLTALALLVAESDPKEKDVMIKIIKNLITE